MRISIRDDDSGYVNYNPNLTYMIYIDGILTKESDQCITFDQELGFALCYKLDEKGLPVIDKTLAEFEEVEIKGVITFKTEKRR
jgi:hypothetical protein|tara:strand:+ start:151 stop:402 length:252 start_codon:yes stop_codon:yes gene_type:complete